MVVSGDVRRSPGRPGAGDVVAIEAMRHLRMPRRVLRPHLEQPRSRARTDMQRLGLTKAALAAVAEFWQENDLQNDQKFQAMPMRDWPEQSVAGRRWWAGG